DILKMTKEEWDSQIDYIRQVIDQFGLMPESDKDIAATGASLEIAALAEDLDTLEALSEDFDNADVTLEYRQKFYDALLKVKEQYLTVRDYLSAEAKERIDAFFADERVKNLGYFVGSLYYMSKSEEGYDLFVSNDGVNFDVITRDGMGDPYNYGSRVFAITNSGLCIGTANPFYGAQVWLLDEDLMMGDVNMDGEVNIFDATEIQFNIAGMVELTDDQMYVADVNYDGEVNIFDVTTIQEFIAGYITEF
ncbi:MAG: dockerin type I repeat-containing protein, partial [Ruminococcus sp.]|nr:dockerin type I repeat-containing protein [Ruminococcus sp.]